MVAILRPPSASLATDAELAVEQAARIAADEALDTALTQSIADEATARANADTALDNAKVSKAANLADLQDVEEARGNLGLGDAATQDAMDLPVSTAQGVELAPLGQVSPEFWDGFDYPDGTRLITGQVSPSGHTHYMTGAATLGGLDSPKTLGGKLITDDGTFYDSIVLDGPMAYMGLEFTVEPSGGTAQFAMINKIQAGPITLGDFLHFDWSKTGGQLRYKVGAYSGSFDGTIAGGTWAALGPGDYHMGWWTWGDAVLLVLSNANAILWIGTGQMNATAATLRGAHCTWEISTVAGPVEFSFRGTEAAATRLDRRTQADLSPGALGGALYALRPDRLVNGNAGAPALAFTNDPTSGAWRVVAGRWAVGAGGSANLDFAATVTRVVKTLWANIDNSLDIGATALAFRHLFLTGLIESRPQAVAPAAVAGKGRIFFQDNGSGKMQLAVRFPTGAIQIVATEP